MLSGLGFPLADMQKDVSVLSGGEKSRVQLAILMTTPADLLILDEPTNHLDLQGIEFVEDFVVRYPGACVVVSHDRRFLDAIANAIVEVADGQANRWKGNFTHYSQQRDLALLTQARAFKSQREFVEKEMEFIRRNMAGRMSAQAKGRLKRLQRLQLIDKPQGKRAQMRLSFGGTTRGQQGQTAIEAEALVMKAGARTLLEGAEFRIWFGEVTALLGRNGAGKTTLLRLLAGIGQPAGGTIKRAHNLRIGYFSQEKNDLPQHGTVLDALRELDRTVDERTLRDHLALFLFCGDDVEKPVGELSGGEKQRLSLARMTRAQFDLLCLDEPTNHLDVAGTEGLEQALKEFPGTVVLITHDRKLVDEVADRVLWVEDGAVRTFDQGLLQCQRVLAEERAAVRAADSEVRAEAARKAAGRGAGGEEGDRDRQGAQPADVPEARGTHHRAGGAAGGPARGDARSGQLRERQQDEAAAGRRSGAEGRVGDRLLAMGELAVGARRVAADGPDSSHSRTVRCSRGEPDPKAAPG